MLSSPSLSFLSPYCCPHIFLCPAFSSHLLQAGDRTGGWAGRRVKTTSPTQYKLWDWGKERSHDSAGRITCIHHPPAVRPYAPCGMKVCTQGRDLMVVWRPSCPALGDNPANPCAREIGSREPTPAPSRLWLSPGALSSGISSRENESLGRVF